MPTLKVFRSDTAENSEKTNIQGARLRTFVKIKTPGQDPAAPKGGCKNMVGEATSPTNPKRDAMEISRKNIQTVRETRRPWRTNAMHEFPRMDLP